MKFAISMACLSCTFVLAAFGCSGDGGDSQPGPSASGTNDQELRGGHRPRPPRGGHEDPPSGPFCGGFGGFPCAGQATCVDDPSDDCDPNNGGADCGGVCECNARALCVRGFSFDPSPEVCACVPEDPGASACAAVLCPVNTTCQVVDGSARCVPNENPCNLIDCRSGDVCELQDGQPVCVSADPGAAACAAVSCPVNSTCEVVDGEARCVPAAGSFCGGIAAFPCAGQATCVDDPSDDCDPNDGGADCGGICECNVRALCVQGFSFDPSPDVCACVPEAPETDPCAAVRCAAGTHCEANGERAECIADVPAECAAVTCLEGTQCVVVDGRAECVANEVPECAAVLCLEGTQCVVVDGRPECVAIERPECAAVLCLEGTHCEVRRGRAECTPNRECRGGRH